MTGHWHGSYRHITAGHPWAKTAVQYFMAPPMTGALSSTAKCIPKRLVVPKEVIEEGRVDECACMHDWPPASHGVFVSILAPSFAMATCVNDSAVAPILKARLERTVSVLWCRHVVDGGWTHGAGQPGPG